MRQWYETVSTKVLALTSRMVWVFYSDLALAWSCGSSVLVHAQLYHASFPEGKRLKAKEVWSHGLNFL